MAEDKEQLKISAELDTSKLKQGAKQGLSEVSKETKKVEQDAQRASKAIDNIGNAGKNVGRAMQQAGQQASSSLKNIGNEAKNTAAQVDNIAKATKQIKLQQALGVANRAVSQLAPVGQALGQAAGMSESDISLAGAGISGAMSGAMIGASIGGPLAPLTAAGGALVGAATSLISAAGELKKAASEQREQARGRYEANLADFNNYQTGKTWNSKVQGYAQRLTGGDTGTYESARGELDREIATLQSEIRGREILIRSVNQSATADIEEAKNKYAPGKKQDEAVKQIYDAYGAQISEYMGDIREKESQLAALTNLQKIQPPKAVTPAVKEVPSPSKEGSKTTAETSDAKLPDNREQISTFQKLLSDNNRVGNVKLTDALTRVGGGVGYGAQMSGIADKVTTISKTLSNILAELKNGIDVTGQQTVFTE